MDHVLGGERTLHDDLEKDKGRFLFNFFAFQKCFGNSGTSYLVGAPVPDGADGQPEGGGGPGQVGVAVAEQVHGVLRNLRVF